MTKPRLLLATRAARALAMGLTGALGVLVLVSACSSSSSPVGPGGECFLATDCAPGLICIEQANKTRVCSDDLSRVAGRPPAGGGAGDAEAEGGDGEGGMPDGQVTDSAPTEDTGAPDTNNPPPPDAAPADAGAD